MRKGRRKDSLAWRYCDCIHCGGRVRERVAAVDYRWGAELLAVVRDVPAGVCEACGEEYVRGDVAKRVEETAHSQVRPVRVLAVPVRPFGWR